MLPCDMPVYTYSYYIHNNIVIIIHTMDSQLGKFMADTAIVNTVLIHQFIFFLGIFHLSKKQIMDMPLVDRCAANGTPGSALYLSIMYVLHTRVSGGGLDTCQSPVLFRYSLGLCYVLCFSNTDRPTARSNTTSKMF